jgi:ubiquinone/menaquinone biosynthesis C-methylase UbiE
MILLDRLHCPDCQGLLLVSYSASALKCVGCQRNISLIDGVADFVGDHPILKTDQYCYRGDIGVDDEASDALLIRIRAAAGDRWPAALGDVLELGCGCGQLTRALAVGHSLRSMVVLDSAIDMVQATRQRIAALGTAAERPALFATLSMNLNAIRDAVADTIVGNALLPGIGNLRTFLSMVQRILKPNGRALFVVSNRRYRQALCQALAEALVQLFARDGAWPDGHADAMGFLAHSRRILIHQGDMDLLSGQEEKHLFDTDFLQDMGREVGFGSAEVIPLSPDPAGAEAARQSCIDAGMPDSAAQSLAPLVASVGKPFFDLLSRQDQSPTMLFWLTKASGPEVRVFGARPQPPVMLSERDTVLGGPAPRWSIEVLPRDTLDGIVVTLGGWCLINTDVLWVRLTIGGITRMAPIWRPRPDVHEVLNRSHHFHPLNVLCSGIDSEFLFTNVHAADRSCPFSLDILLANGVTISGPIPEQLVMDERIVIGH